MSATMPSPVVDEHDLALLDFEISCAAEDCEHVADWWMVCLACGAHTPVCEPHRREQVLAAESAGPLAIVVCDDCRCAVRARAWRRQFSFVPVGRRP